MQLESWKKSPITDVLFHSNMQGDFFHLYNDILMLPFILKRNS